MKVERKKTEPESIEMETNAFYFLLFFVIGVEFFEGFFIFTKSPVTFLLVKRCEFMQRFELFIRSIPVGHTLSKWKCETEHYIHLWLSLFFSLLTHNLALSLSLSAPIYLMKDFFFLFIVATLLSLQCNLSSNFLVVRPSLRLLLSFILSALLCHRILYKFSNILAIQSQIMGLLSETLIEIMY